MTTIKARDVKANLPKKGFVEDRSRDHINYWYQPEGKKTVIKTKISHSANDIGDSLIGKMSRQTHLDKQQFLDLVNCPLSKEDYYEIVKKYI